MAEGRWDVFVSYGHEDAEWVGVLAGNLHRDGFEVFFDEWELVGGDRVTGRLEEGIRRSKNGVLVVSPHSLSRPGCGRSTRRCCAKRWRTRRGG